MGALIAAAAEEADRLVERIDAGEAEEAPTMSEPLTRFDVDPDGVALLRSIAPTPATR